MKFNFNFDKIDKANKAFNFIGLFPFSLLYNSKNDIRAITKYIIILIIGFTCFIIFGQVFQYMYQLADQNIIIPLINKYLNNKYQ